RSMSASSRTWADNFAAFMASCGDASASQHAANIRTCSDRPRAACGQSARLRERQGFGSFAWLSLAVLAPSWCDAVVTCLFLDTPPRCEPLRDFGWETGQGRRK